MKIFTNNRVYVQNNDLVYLMRGTCGKSVPTSIINKVFGEMLIVDDSNRYDFVEFSSLDEVEFFRNCDWIVDYNTFDGMTEDEILEYGCLINENRNKIAQAYNELSEKERKKEYMRVSTEIELLEFKILSVRDILWHKKGYLKFSLPADVKENNLIKSSIIETEPVEIKRKENIIQKVLCKLRKSNN